jgi:hypothetical protein
MREDSPLGRLAFGVVTALAILWAAGVFGVIVLGVVEQPLAFWPAAIALGPIILIGVAVILDRLRSPEDRRYSRDVHD